MLYLPFSPFSSLEMYHCYYTQVMESKHNRIFLLLLKWKENASRIFFVMCDLLFKNVNGSKDLKRLVTIIFFYFVF